MDTHQQDTSKEHEEQPEESAEAQSSDKDSNADSPEVEDSTASGEPTIEEERDAEEENAFLVDQLQRAHAELANFRRRTLEDQASQRMRTTVSIVRSFLPVLDGLEAAIKAGGDEGGDEGIRQGLTMIAERVEGVLADLKIRKNFSHRRRI